MKTDILPHSHINNAESYLTEAKANLGLGKKIAVNYIEMDELIDVEVEHECDWRDYPEVCQSCYENHIDGLQQFEEDQYRDTD